MRRILCCLVPVLLSGHALSGARPPPPGSLVLTVSGETASPIGVPAGVRHSVESHINAVP